MNSQPENPWQQPPYVGWQEPQNVMPAAVLRCNCRNHRNYPDRPVAGLGCAIAAIVAVVALIVIGGVICGGVALYHLKDRIPGMHKEQFQTV